MKKSVIPRPTETAALANLTPRPARTVDALYTDLHVTRRTRDLEGFTLVGHQLLRALLGKLGER